MAQERVRRKLAAILAADVVGYSRLMREDEAGTLAKLKSLTSEVVGPTIEGYEGRIFKTTGDGLLAEFSSAIDAVQAAIDIQHATEHWNRDLDENSRLQLRIGINLGDVIVEGPDLFGDGVNVATRLEGLADTGGITVAAMVHEGVRHQLDIEFNDLGEQSLKNIPQPVRAFKIAMAQAAGSEGVSTEEALFRRPAVAVLPFENLSGDPDHDYFADGLTEDVITALSLWRTFPVIARNSTFAYKGSSPDIRTVGEDLGAYYVIEGSVRRSGNRVRVTAQLINAETGHHVWAERYDRDLEDIFELQDELTGQIVATVAPELERSEHRRAVEGRPQDLNAWDQYQRGMAHLYEFSREGNELARDAFKKAIAIEPNYSGAYTGLAWSYTRDMLLGFAESLSETTPKAVAASRKAVELDRTDSSAHLIFGVAVIWESQFEQSVKEFERAIELNPNHANAHGSLGNALAMAGKPEEGIFHLERALQLNPKDPLNHIFYSFMARAHLTAHRYEEATNWAQKAMHLRDDNPEQRLVLASALGHMGHLEEAGVHIGACERLRPGFTTNPAGWHQYKIRSDTEHFLDGLRKAGWDG
jgi:adenylate cyclase